MKNKHRLFLAIIAVVATVVVGAIGSKEAHAAGACTVATFADFASCWISQSAETDINITVVSDIVMTGGVAIPTGKNVTIRSGDERKTLTRDPGYGSNLFSTWSGAADKRLTFENIIIDGNSANTVVQNDGSIITAGGNNITLTIGNGAILRNNKKDVNAGGGIFISQGTLNIDGGVITGNITPSTGGGISASNAATVNLIDGEISDNVASVGGGVALLGFAQLNVQGGEISRNTATVSGRGWVIRGGGGIYSTSVGKVSLSGNVVINSNRARCGGGIYAKGTAVDVFDNVQIVDNHSDIKCGGGGVMGDNGSSLNISGSVLIAENSGGTGGGGINAYGDLYISENVVIEKNWVTAEEGVGGGVVCSGTIAFPGVCSIMGGSIRNNRAWRGAGLNSSYMPVTISGDTVISGNIAEDNGGGIRLATATATADISGPVRITDNVSAADGGGVWVRPDSIVNITVGPGVVFASNRAASYTPCVGLDDRAKYFEHILGTSWTSPFTHGWNNYDISYSTTLHRVTFDSGGGSLVDGFMVCDGNAVDEPAPPSRDGFEFVMWSTDGVAEYDFSIPVIEDMTLIGVWRKLPEVPATGVPESLTRDGGVLGCGIYGVMLVALVSLIVYIRRRI